MKHCFILLFILSPLSILNSQVTINVPGDYTTIQEGINAANNGDLVLVADGTYIENINFIGKAITVASHFIQDGDKSHIDNTIIDGSQPLYPDSASVVTFRSGEDTSSVLCGFTITGGTGTLTPSLLTRAGGGIFVFISGAKICNNIIEFNSVNFPGNQAFGGGIVAGLNSTTIINNNIIRNNSVNGTYPFGGGISLNNSGLTYILSNKIIDNEAIGNYASGGGIDASYIVGEAVINGNYIKGNDTQVNGYGGGGIDLYSWGALITVCNNIIVDNIARWGGGILAEYDLEAPSKFKAQRLPTEYSEEIPLIVNNTIINNLGAVVGGIYGLGSTPDVMNNIVWGNTYNSGGQITGATVTYSDIEGGYTGTGNINNLPLFDMTTEYNLLSLGSPCIDAGNPDPMYNDIEHIFNPGYAMPPAHDSLRNDMGHCGGPQSQWCHWQWPIVIDLPTAPILVEPTGQIDTTAVEFSWTQSQPVVTRYWFEIDTTNQFTTSFVDSLILDTTYLYSSLEYGNNYWWRIRAFNATGWGEFSDVGSLVITSVEDDNQLPIEFCLMQNYPNPFNPVTTIKYSIPEESDVSLIVYNTLGEEVATLVNESKKVGNYEIMFDAAALPSGIYFYQIKADNFVQVKKMMLLK